MDSPNWFLTAINTSAFLLCVSFLLYSLCIVTRYRTETFTTPGHATDFDWHFFVPCLNEETVIEATVRHLTRTFPLATLWCIDDGSTDATGTVLAALELELPALRVLTRRLPEARQGKGAALNAAWEALSEELPAGGRDRVIVGVIDADGRLDSYCPDLIAGPERFGDARVGAVQIRVRVTTDVEAVGAYCPDMLSDRAADEHLADPILVQLQDIEFSGPIAAMQMLRQHAGSVGMGGNGQFTRMSVLDRVALEFGTPWHGALLEDFELGLHVLLSGSRNEYAHDTWVAQEGLTRVRPLLRQRSRWSQGGMQCTRYLWQVFSSTRVPLAGALETAYYLWVPWSQMLGSIVFPVAIGVDAYYAVHGTAGGTTAWIANGAWGLVPLALLFGVLPQAMWGPLHRAHQFSSLTWGRAVVLGLTNIAYGYLLQAAAWWAFYRMLRGRRDWKKTTHDAPLVATSSGGSPATVSGSSA